MLLPEQYYLTHLLLDESYPAGPLLWQGHKHPSHVQTGLFICRELKALSDTRFCRDMDIVLIVKVL